MGLLLVVQVTLPITPATHLLGPPPLTSLSPSLPPQPEQGHTLQYLPTQRGHKCDTGVCHNTRYGGSQQIQISVWTNNSCFPAVPVVITELRVSSSTHCLLNGTSVDIHCVNFGFPRQEIIFFRGAEQITPGQGSFSNFARVPNKFDTIRLTGAQQTDGGQYVCEARDGSRQLTRSLPVDLVFCSKC